MRRTGHYILLNTLAQTEGQIVQLRQQLCSPMGRLARAKVVASLLQLALIQRAVFAKLRATGYFPGRDKDCARAADLLRRLGRWSLITFLCAGGTLLADMASPLSLEYQMLIGIPALCLIFLCGFLYIVLIPVREFIIAGHRPWRFTVRNLLVLTTVVACALGVIYFIAQMFARSN
jgi:hypothetical protein